MRESVTKLRLTLFILLAMLVSQIVCEGARPPLGKVQVLGLIAAGAPGGEVASLVRRDGLDFVASPEFLALLKQSGASTDPDWGDLAKALASARVSSERALGGN